MATINTLIKRLEAVNVNEIVHQTLESTKGFTADLQVEQQLKGLTADGTPMPDYSRTSVEVFGKEGPIKLRDTGAFQRGIYVKAMGDKITISSTDDKTKMLEERFGKKGFSILGLNSGSRKEWKEDLQPVLIDIVKKKTGL